MDDILTSKYLTLLKIISSLYQQDLINTDEKIILIDQAEEGRYEGNFEALRDKVAEMYKQKPDVTLFGMLINTTFEE